MPLPLIPIAIGGGLIAAAARGTALLAERSVKNTNAEIQAAERRAAEKNQQYASRRLQRKNELEESLAKASLEYESFLAAHRLTLGDVAEWKPEPWLQQRMGELIISRPLLIQPQFNAPATANQVAGQRMMIDGQIVSRTNPNLGQNMQGLGAIAAVGAYISQQTNTVVDATKYNASARAYLFALAQTIDGFDARFAFEVEDDRRSVHMLVTLLHEVQPSGSALHTEAVIKNCAIVHRRLVESLTALIGKYS